MNKNGIEYCKICKELPNAHSFELVCYGRDIREKDEDKKKVSVFYTRVANAIRYDDSNGIIEHYTNLLKLENPKKWIWIFDCNGFGLRHSIQIKTAIRIAKLINNFGNVHRILVINSNFFINTLFHGITAFLNNEIISNTIMINSDEKTKYILELSVSKYSFNKEDYHKLINLITL
jgi:hypothetical protein